MPDISSAAGYLVALLRSAGYATATGMGLVGLSWQEIEAWARCNDFLAAEDKCCATKLAGRRQKKKKLKTASVVGPRELRAVWHLSRVYASEVSASSKKGCKPPYTPPVEDVKDEVVREMVAEKAEDVFEAMIRAQMRE